MREEHFILKGRLVGTDQGWADCTCGWHIEGTLKDVLAAGLDHQETEKAKQALRDG